MWSDYNVFTLTNLTGGVLENGGDTNQYAVETLKVTDQTTLTITLTENTDFSVCWQLWKKFLDNKK